MNATDRTMIAICVGAGLGYWTWSGFLSRGAQIGSLHKSCMAARERYRK